MKNKAIWAPWRAEYILGPKEKGCIFCNRLKKRSDFKNLIVHRGEKVFVILNKFPYNSGHSMVVPKRHLASLDDMTKTEAIEFFEMIRLTIRVTRKAFNPDSFNIGMNMGAGSGAGIPEHVHMHIVPRWAEDTNFMPVIGNTEVVSFPLELIYEKMKKGFDDLCLAGKSRPKRS
ncbi:MAG: HIT domain-containing protein [Candidatus Zixiibacteriota bacterium]